MRETKIPSSRRIKTIKKQAYKKYITTKDRKQEYILSVFIA